MGPPDVSFLVSEYRSFQESPFLVHGLIDPTRLLAPGFWLLSPPLLALGDSRSGPPDC